MEFFDTAFLGNDELKLQLTKTDAGDSQRGIAPTYYFDIIRLADDANVGRCEFRIGHGERLYFTGNVGYDIFREYRGNRYAAKASALLFALARKHGMEYIIITCRPHNIASRRTIERIGGRLVETARLPTTASAGRGEADICVYRVEIDEK